MTIRIPDFLFARSSGQASAPGEPDQATRNAVAEAQSAAAAMSALGRSVGLAGEALSGGERVAAKVAAARKALGTRAESGAFRLLLDRAAAAQAHRETTAGQQQAMRALIDAIKSVGALPVPFAEKAELGRTLLQEGLAQGLVRPEQLADFEPAMLSQFGLGEAMSAVAGAIEPGEALAVLSAAESGGALLPMDLALLQRRAQEQDSVATARHRGRLTMKEQDDLAAFARGELPEPLSEESFALIHGARGATGAHTRYQAARREGEALATIRGKEPDAIEAARADWQGDPMVFDAAVAKDAAERARDPAGYALATSPASATAYARAAEAERGAMLWAAQAAAGIPENQRSPWTLAEEEAMAEQWAALPAGVGGAAEKLGFFRKHLMTLPAEMRAAAIRRLEQQGIADGTEAELVGIVHLLEEGRTNPARVAAGALGTRPAIAGSRSASLSNIVREKRPGLAGDQAIPVQAVPAPFTPLTSMPGIPTLQEGIDTLVKLFDSSQPSYAPPDTDEPVERTAEPRESNADVLARPGARSAVDELSRSGLTTTEAEAVVVEILKADAGIDGTFNLAAFTSNYAALLPAGSSDPAVREKATSDLAEVFRSIQAHEGRMTLAELALLRRSPDYSALSGRGAAWIDDDTVAIGDAVVTADGEQLVVETADGLLFAWREGTGPTARYIVDDVVYPDDLIALQGSASRAARSGYGALLQ